MLFPVLLCGGVGSRLWPLSREAHPKQFLSLVGELSMLQETVQRTSSLDTAAPVVLCNEAHRFMVAEQLRQLEVTDARIILEPEARSTAPAVALAALWARARDPEACLLVLPADHVIENVERFADAVRTALPVAAGGRIMTFGIVPTAPETGYGYIRCGGEVRAGVRAIDRFVEKPDLTTAERYLELGDYLWNSGMFLFRADAFLRELGQYAPAIVEACELALGDAEEDLDFLRPDPAAFAAAPEDSIDYAVMEKTQHGAVVPLACGWSDVGAWSTLWDVGERDDAGNVVVGDVMVEDSSGSYLRSEGRLLAAIGVQDLVVVETDDAVLVADRNRVQDVKAIVSRLKALGRREASLHNRVYRPWGSYEALIISGRFQVQRIVVDPGHTLSLQMHHHRAEHWIVVRGTAEVSCDDRTFMLGEDESTYIPLGRRHRLGNPGRIPLEVIEVQSGSYLGDDDIVRFEDAYGRVG